MYLFSKLYSIQTGEPIVTAENWKGFSSDKKLCGSGVPGVLLSPAV